MLLIVGGKVLDRPGHAPAVQPTQLGAGHLSGQKRILGEILEIAAIQRMAVDVDAGAQQRVHMVFAQFQPFHRVEFLTQIFVECRSQAGAIGHGESNRAAVHADTAGTIGTAGGRQTVVLQSIADTADSPGCTRRNARRVHPLAPDDGAKLVVAELCDKISHVHLAVGHILQTDALVPGLGALFWQTDHTTGLGQFGLGRDRLPCGGTVRTGAQPLKSCGGCSGGFLLLHHHQRQRDRKGLCGMAYIGTETENIVTGFQHKGRLVPGSATVIIAGKIAPRRSQHQSLALPGSQCFGFGKSTQHLSGLAQKPLRRGAVQLYDLFAGTGADIFDRGNGCDPVGAFVRAQQLNLKFCVRKSETKGIQHFFRRKCFKVAIADIDILGIEIAVVRTVVVSSRVIRRGVGNRVGQFAAGADRAVQHIQHTAAALLSALPDVSHRAGVISRDPLHINDVANIEQHNRFIEIAAYQRQHIFFVLGQQKAAGGVCVVLILARCAANDDERRIGALGGSADKFFVQRHFRLEPWFLRPAGTHLVGVVCQPCGIAGLHLGIQPIAAVTAQYLRQIRHMGHIDQSAGSGSAFIVVKLCVPKQGRPAAGSQR